MKFILLTLLLGAAVASPNLDTLLLQLKRVLGDEVTQPESCGFEGDVVFVVDASSSISEDDFNISKTFVKDLIGSLGVGGDKVRVGLAVFNQFVHITFNLNKVTEEGQDATTLQELVDTSAGISTGTFTDKALRAVREQMFTPESGDRPDVPNIVIVVTDGRSRKPVETAQEAVMLRQAGVIMFAIAVGRWRSDGQLQALASDPNEDFKFAVDDFGGLEAIKPKLVEKTCKALEKPPAIIPECYAIADILFVIDGSKSIQPESFQTAKTYISTLLDSFVVSPDHVRVAVLTFDQKVYHGFYLDEYKTVGEVKEATMKLEQHVVGTLTHKALEAARKNYFNPIHGDREDAPNILILLTDGRSRNQEKTLTQAAIDKEFDITIMTIGIGHTKIEELETVASTHPETELPMTFRADDFDKLVEVTENLVDTTCKVQNVDVPPCEIKLDIMFVLDLSTSAGEHKTSIQDFVDKMADGYVLGAEAGQIGFITFNKNAYLDLKLSESVTKEAIKTKLGEMRETAAGTMTWKALDLLRTEAFTVENGGRPDARKLVIILSDGQSRNFDKTVEAATKVHEAGITTFVVTVGNFKPKEVEAIASEPADFFTYPVEKFEQIFSLIHVLKKKTCEREGTEQPAKRLLLQELEALVEKLDQKRGNF